MLLGGDFNCVITPTDCTGGYNYSRSLDMLIKEFGLIDAWQANLHSRAYTHYTNQGAARLDRLYISADLNEKKTGATLLFAPFTDHLAVTVRTTLAAPMARRGKGTWKMNNGLFAEPNFKENLLTLMKQWKVHQRRYTDAIVWWDSYVKKQLKHHFSRKGAEKKKEEEANISFLHTCIYEVLQSDAHEQVKTAALRKCKAEILLIHKRRMASTNLKTHQHATTQNERTSLYQLIKAKRRRASTMIGHIADVNGSENDTMHGIMRVFTQHMQLRFSAKTIDEESMHTIESIRGKTITKEQQQSLKAPITREELRRAIYGGSRNKAPGSDGVSLEFFQETWDEFEDTWLQVFQKMYALGKLTPQQKHGLIVCIPKTHRDNLMTSDPSHYLMRTIKFLRVS
jgi:hypothetical protein